MPEHRSQAEPVRPYKVPESVLVVIHTVELELLLIKRADAGDFWQSVTGSKDTAAESLVETAAREVAEETGIDCGSGTPLADSLRAWNVINEYDIYPQWRHRYDPAVNRNTEHLFGLCVPRNVKVTLNPREHIDFKWLPWREAADCCFSPSNAEAILMLPSFLR